MHEHLNRLADDDERAMPDDIGELAADWRGHHPSR
jgi:hypothetical protein